MHPVFLLVGLFVFIHVVFLFERKRKSKRLREWIKENYGKKPTKAKHEWEKVGSYWSHIAESIAEDEKIDDVTWNDLEMNHVFSRINNCTSFVGEQVLYATLHCLSKDNLYREIMEKKIGFFTSNETERENIQIVLSNLGKDYGSYYIPMFINNLGVMGIAGIWGYRIMQMLLAVSVLPAIIMQNPVYLFITGAVFFVNMLIYFLNKTKYDVNLDMLKAVIGIVKAGNQIADTKNFSYQAKFQDLKKQALLFKKLSHMIGRLEKKKEVSYMGGFEGMAYDYLIGATLWDFTKYNQILRALKGRQNEFMELYKRIGEIDMQIAIASFRMSLPFFCTPTFGQEQVLQMEEIYHPLLDEPIGNIVTIDNSCIITGSNASGKSTFIKAIVINVILAQCIHTCMAKQMRLPYARIITSMAVRDDLMAGESYYIKEIKYLNRIIQSLSEERLVICAIDEILRGTNTEERIAASAAILKFICTKNCIAIVASHDIELTRILEGIYDNYHFREQIKEHDIVFDYKIQEGASNSKNAIQLLEYVGFPEEIIVAARKHCRSNADNME